MTTHTFRESETIVYNQSETRISNLQSILASYFVNLKSLHRIECYDASQNGMSDAVVSMVVAVDGLLDHGQYRRFKVKNPRAISDFDRLEEALIRRLKNARWPRPDLIVIDGGTPQLRRLQRVFDQLAEPPLYVGLAKHPDHLVLPDLQGQALKGSKWITLKLDQTGPTHALLAQLRDEAHRFANSYRQALEKKRTKISL
jgi:excinuclease ABC subunit C